MLPRWQSPPVLGMAVGAMALVAVGIGVLRVTPQEPIVSIPAQDEAPTSSTVANSPAPARTSFDFYTVLPEIERVISETGAFETAPAAPKSQSMPAESKSKASPGGFYMLQAGAYKDPGQAERMKARLALAGFEPSVQHISVQGRGDFYRVRVGPYSSMDLMETANRERKAESKEFNPLPESRAPPHQK